jgi:dipeptidyl aminopeptidase/acylaminoacyl peptidase
MVSNERIDDVNYVKASTNYFVLRSNHRAPSTWLNPGKSAAYDAAAVGLNGVAVTSDDVLSGVNSLAGSGLIDQSRMCIVGFSNGGLEAAQILTRTKQFRCAALQSPSTADWALSFFLSTETTPPTLRHMYGLTPWDNPDLYTSLTPLYQANKITTPMLLAAGDLEPNVLPTVELYNALRYLGREVTLLRYPTQGHGFSGAADEDFTQRLRTFFSTYLGD